MMKSYLSILAGFIFISNSVLSQFTLTVEIADIRNNNGKIMLQAFDEKEKVIDQQMSDIKDKKVTLAVKNLKPGKYAVRFYHDENLNQLMETNMVGKPTEGYGFSNNVTGRFGMPPFEKWLFDLNEDKKIVIKTVY
jgi:uncharacterized protein (DUF2141 family)